MRFALVEAWKADGKIVPLENCKKVLRRAADLGADLPGPVQGYLNERDSPSSLDSDWSEARVSKLDQRWPSVPSNPRQSTTDTQGFDAFMGKFFELYKKKGDAVFESLEQSSLVDYDESDSNNSEVDAETVSKTKQIKTALSLVVQESEWAQQESEVSPHPEAAKGMFVTQKRKDLSLPFPAGWRELNSTIATQSRQDIIPQYFKYVYRLRDEHWAELLPASGLDDLIASSAKSVFRGGKQCLTDDALNSCSSFVDSSASHVAEVLRVLAASSHAASHAWDVTNRLKELLDAESSTAVQDAKPLINKLFSSVQLAQTAVCDSASALIKYKHSASRFVRQLWLDQTNLSKDVKVNAKSLPLPMGSLDDMGRIQKPDMFGPSLEKLVDKKYHDKKYLEKVSVPSVSTKRPAADYKPDFQKKFKKDQQSKGGSQSQGQKGRKRFYSRKKSNKRSPSKNQGNPSKKSF